MSILSTGDSGRASPSLKHGPKDPHKVGRHTMSTSNIPNHPPTNSNATFTLSTMLACSLSTSPVIIAILRLLHRTATEKKGRKRCGRTEYPFHISQPFSIPPTLSIANNAGPSLKRCLGYKVVKWKLLMRAKVPGSGYCRLVLRSIMDKGAEDRPLLARAGPGSSDRGMEPAFVTKNFMRGETFFLRVKSI